VQRIIWNQMSAVFIGNIGSAAPRIFLLGTDIKPEPPKLRANDFENLLHAEAPTNRFQLLL
jgi:hypothetical protein